MDFIQKIEPIISKYAQQYGIKCISVVIAQACLESAYGTSELAINANNFFGLKYRAGRCPSCSGIYYKIGSEQNADGSYTSSTMKWCRFNTIEDGIKGYFDFINISRYSNLKGVSDYKEYAKLIREDGYATSLNYIKNIINVVEKYNLQKYDIIEKDESKMLPIIKNLCKKYYSSNSVEYIVVHYTGSAEGTALAVSNYFKNSTVSSSAHYVVDWNSIYQCVEEKYGAWHAGNSYYNKHSIGIEICCHKTNKKSNSASDKDWYFDNDTLNNVLDLIWDLKKRYPDAKIIRHYDVTKKICPAPFVHDLNKYNEFLNHVNTKTYYGTDEVPPASTQNGSYLVRVTADVLNIREKASSKSKKVGQIKDKGVYTIVETKGNWGKLKSGLGWICLKYTKKI